MNRFSFFPSRLLAALGLALSATAACAAGFQQGLAADPQGKALEIGIWYPSRAAAAPLAMGPNTQTVAVNSPVEGKGLPLVVVSHGTGGSFMGHYDSAIALADAGYVVAAVTHTGDNYRDQSRAIDIMDRPRQISRVIDHLLSTWDGRAHINPARIGIFGFSAGGFTALVNIGGVPDFTRIGPVCKDHPEDYGCQLLAKASPTDRSVPSTAPATDVRIKAAVIAAPALGFTFAPDGLKQVRVPVQLWRAEDDVILPHPRYAEAVRQALPQAPDYRVVSKAGHFDFLVPCSLALAQLAPEICKSAPGFDRAAFHQTFNAAVIEFFGKTLKPQ